MASLLAWDAWMSEPKHLGGGSLYVRRAVSNAQKSAKVELRANRICRKSALMIWVKELKRAFQLLLNMKGRYAQSSWAEKRPLWVEVREDDWEQVRKMIRTVRDHKVWGERVNPEIVAAIASTRQKDWQDILLEGTLPGREEQLLPPLDQNYMFQSI